MSYEVSNFEAQVLERSKQVPVLVDFWAPWCAPCRTLGPVLERLASQAMKRWELAKVNTEEHQDLAAAYDISSIPAVKLFVNGQVVDEFVGALPEREIRRFLDKALPSPNAAQIREAERLMQKGNYAEAASILEKVSQNEPGNAQARVLLAQALLTSAPERIPGVLESVNSDSDLADKADALRRLGELAQLPSQPGLAPGGKLRDRYLQGATALRSGDFSAALQAFIEVLERNKNFAGGGAKEACKAIFQLLGRQHPVTERFLRPFSSALHN